MPGGEPSMFAGEPRSPTVLPSQVQGGTAPPCLENMTTMSHVEPNLDPEPLPDLTDDGDRPSITEVNGTVARFDMAYQPTPNERYAFGPTWLSRVPSLLWFAFSLGVTTVVVLAYHMSSNSALTMWVAERNRNGIPPSVLAFVVLASGIATLVRTHMRGIIVQRDGLEARYILPLGVPRVRRWSWAQVHRMIVDPRDGVILELWTGQYEKLPFVARTGELISVLQHKGAEHGIAVTQLE
jgi:hypothetical protein